MKSTLRMAAVLVGTVLGASTGPVWAGGSDVGRQMVDTGHRPLVAVAGGGVGPGAVAVEGVKVALPGAVHPGVA